VISKSSTAPWHASLGDLLHFNQVLSSISELCYSDEGQERVQALWPITDPDILAQRFGATGELCTVLEQKSPPPLSNFPDIRSALERASRGSVLIPEEFNDVRQVLQLLMPLQQFFHTQESLVFWRDQTHELDAWPEGLKQINRVVDEDLTIKSTASSELQRIRSAISRLEAQVRKRLETIHTDAGQSGWAQEEPIAWREGRLVIALKTTHKRKIQGLIHGYSGSGATTFVEPLETFEMNNELAALRDDEKAEELRLLALLSDALHTYAEELSKSMEVLYQLDTHLAQARWAVQQDAVRPILTTTGELELTAARNPVLAAHREVVPLDLHLGDPEHILLISGPNAGGKTVVLLTVGLFVMLAQSGLFLPARAARIPVFNQFYSDLGDRQSLEDDLSTFSAHLANLRVILSQCDKTTLVLLDELGTGTEPEAGAALGQTFLETIRDRKSFCLATTHLNRLKLWTQEETGILNAGMAFDSQELRPTYRLEVGRPGASYALEIARRMGLDEQLLARAEMLMPETSLNMEDLLTSLEEDRVSIQRLKQELERQVNDLEGREQQLAEKEAEIKVAHRRAHKDALREAQQLVADMNRRLEGAIAEVRSKGAELTREDIRHAKETVRLEKRELTKRGATLKEEEPAALTMDDIQPGMWVTLREQNRSAQVVKRYQSKQRVMVTLGDIRLTLPVEQLAPGTEPPSDESEPTGRKTRLVGISLAGQVSYRLDLRGQRGDEAIAEVDRFLNRAILAGLSELEIIHGKGTGALQKRVQEFLQDHPHVKSFGFADFDAGGTGVTLVELK
jgi:DNA mismatch repair protein MutS2